MKIDEIVMLINAGYTKQDIDALVSVKEPEAKSEANPEVKPEANPEVKSEAAEQHDDKTAQLETKLDYVINRLNYLAVKNSQQPEQGTETIDDILAKVIR